MRIFILSAIFALSLSITAAEKQADVEFFDGKALQAVMVSESPAGYTINNGLTRVFYEKSRVKTVAYSTVQSPPTSAIDSGPRTSIDTRSEEEKRLFAENYLLRARVSIMEQQNAELRQRLQSAETEAKMSSAGANAIRNNAADAYATARRAEERNIKLATEAAEAKFEADLIRGRAIGAEVDAARTQRQAESLATEAYINGLKDGNNATRTYVNEGYESNRYRDAENLRRKQLERYGSNRDSYIGK